MSDPAAVAEVVRDHYPGIPNAAELLSVAADKTRSDDERQAASARLVQLDRERILRERARKGGAAALRDVDVWEESLAKALDVSAPAAPRRRFLRPLSAADIYRDANLDELRWLWEGYIPEESLVMLASFMKEGKSTLAYALLGAMVSGRDFLGRSTKSVSVLVLAVEEHLRDVKAHLCESGIGPDAPVMIHSGPYPNTQEGLAELRSFIGANGIKLLVIDTLSRFWRIKNENDSAEVIELLGPVLDLARDLHITVLLLHHTIKGQSGAEFAHGREIRGGGAIFGLLDQALILSRAKGGASTTRVLRTVGRFRETPEETLIDFDEEAGFRVVESGNTTRDRDAAREQKFLAFVLTSPGRTRTEVQSGAKVGRQRGLRLIESMVREGRLVERDGGLYISSEPLAELAGTTRNLGGKVPAVPAPPKGGVPGTGTAVTVNLAEPAETRGPA